MKALQEIKVLGISGSYRRDSYNRKLLAIAMDIVVKTGASPKELDLKKLNIPMYDGDTEQAGLPENVQHMKREVEGADMLIISSPEYNYSAPPILKNALDWGSRQGNCWGGKTAVLCGASNGAFGTVCNQFHLRQIFLSLDILALPRPHLFLKNGEEAFASDGTLKDAKTAQILEELIHKTLLLTQQRSVVVQNST